MYRHVLLATDGSPASSRAVCVALELARALQARLTVLHTTPVFRPGEMHAHAILREASQDARRSREQAHKALDSVARHAQAAGVECEPLHEVSDTPWRAIIDAATERGCDVIVMGSHGKHGVHGLFSGSQLDRVLIHCQTPVLVCN